MESNSFITFEEILTEIVDNTNDQEFLNRSRGWYKQHVQRAIRELQIDSHYEKRTDDIFNWNSQNNLALDIPEGAFNIQEIYLFNGDCCKPESSVKVYWKRLYNNKGGNGTYYTASSKDDGSHAGDPLFVQVSGDSNLFYANIQEGKLMLSSNSSAYAHMRLVYNGMIVPGQSPLVPLIFEDAIIDFVCERFFRAAKVQDRTLRPIWADYKEEMTSLVGSWQKAKLRASKMDKFKWETMREAMGMPNS